jgi:arylsulfatase A-like enzyme
MAQDRPNVIYILGDDHRADYLGAAGHPVLETPNLDQLGSEGMRFSNAFCTSPACTPSRTCHYLGQWERKHGVNFNSRSSVDPVAWDLSFPMLLKQNGYFTGWVGKNHVPAGLGGYTSGYFEEVFDFWYGNHGHSGFYPKERAGGEIYRNARADTQVEVFEEAVLNFLRPRSAFLDTCASPLSARPEGQPFCLCVTFNLPHGASTGTMQLRPSDDEIYRSAYRDRQDLLPVPATYMSRHDEELNPKIPRDIYNGVRINQYDYVKTPDFLKERQVRTCQTVAGMDRMIGRVREELDVLGLAENTIIVFSTDHGLHHGEHGLGGKCFLYEQDLNIPMIVLDPRLRSSNDKTAHDELVVAPDLAPTMLELAGIEVPHTMQGTSLAPLLRGENTEWRADFFAENLFDGQNYPRSECVRSKEWKYIRYFHRTTDPTLRLQNTYGTKENYAECLNSSLEGEMPVYEELYDLINDPNERLNVADSVGTKDILDSMRNRIIELGHAAKGGPEGPQSLPLDSGGPY